MSGLHRPNELGKEPSIHRHSNNVLRETQSQDVTCAHCGMIFQP